MASAATAATAAGADGDEPARDDDAMSAERAVALLGTMLEGEATRKVSLVRCRMLPNLFGAPSAACLVGWGSTSRRLLLHRVTGGAHAVPPGTCAASGRSAWGACRWFWPPACWNAFSRCCRPQPIARRRLCAEASPRQRWAPSIAASRRQAARMCWLACELLLRMMTDRAVLRNNFLFLFTTLRLVCKGIKCCFSLLHLHNRFLAFSRVRPARASARSARGGAL
jgi:hypothetical protein